MNSIMKKSKPEDDARMERQLRDNIIGCGPEGARNRCISLAALRFTIDGTQAQNSRLIACCNTFDDDQFDSDDGLLDADPVLVAAAIIGHTPGATELTEVFGVGNVSRPEAAMFVRKIAMGWYCLKDHRD